MRVLITGGNRGIGAELTRQYREAGHQVIATSRSGETGFELDVTDVASQAMFAGEISDLAIDLLVCNAGVYLDKGHDLDGYPPEMWAETFETNVTGVFLTIQSLLPNVQVGGGKIAIISSQMASQELAPGGAYIYRASKAAVLNVGRNMAQDFKAINTPVGIYHPGWVRTDMGGDGADISVEQAAGGLIKRFDALSMATTGCFETWDGQTYPF